MATATANETRERILRATLRLIGEHGIGAISNRRIAAASEVALGSLTYHFPSQSELLREALLLYVHEEVGRMQEIAAELRRAAPTPASAAAEVEAIVAISSSRLEEIAELEAALAGKPRPRAARGFRALLRCV